MITTNKLTLLAAIHPRLVELAKKIDLGEKWTTGECYPHPMGQKNDPVRYPTMYISGRPQKVNIPEKGKAMVDYRVKSRSMNKNGDEDERHSIDIEIQSIEPVDENDKPVKEGDKARLLLHDLRRFVGFDDTRSRNSLGQFIGNETDGIDPNSMAAAYGPPAVQPVNPMSESHVERIKRFFAGRRNTAAAAA